MYIFIFISHCASYIEDRFVNLVRVSRKGGGSNVSQSQWVWSELFAWKNAPWANDRCKKWHLKEPNPDVFKGISIVHTCSSVYSMSCELVEVLNFTVGIPGGQKVMVISFVLVWNFRQKFARNASVLKNDLVHLSVNHDTVHSTSFFRFSFL